jgi:hypothetical protein
VQTATGQRSLLFSISCLRRLARPSVSAARALDRALGDREFLEAAAGAANGAAGARLTGSRFGRLFKKSSTLVCARSIL